MLIYPYVFLMITFSENGIVITPRVTTSAAHCQQMIDAQREAANPRVLAQCVPYNASLEIETSDKPTS